MSDVLAFYAAIGVDLPDRPGNVPVRCFRLDHDDRNASASVDTSTGSWFCHACNKGGGPYQAAIEMGREPRDAAELAKRHGFWEDRSSNGRGEAAVYSYTDELGHPLFEVVRFHPKEFRQRLPDGTWKLGDTRRVPYQLPKVIEAVKAGATVYIVEGEKDVAAIERVGGVATTNPGGAGKWRKEYGEHLTGASVVVVADLDKPGRDHALKVAKSLRFYTDDVVIANPAAGKDPHDHVAAGHGLADFMPDVGEPEDDESKPEQPKAGSAIVLVEPEHWAEPVDGEELADAMLAAVRRHVAMTEESAVAIVLWVLFTFLHDKFRISPILGVTSPTKRCGKSTLLSVIRRLVPRPLPSANITSATLYRVIEAAHPTLIVDEADTFLGDRQDIIGIVNSGHSRDMAFTLRTVGDGANAEVRQFSTWAPKVFAAIGRLPETFEDRALSVRLKRRKPDEKVEELEAGENPYEDLRSMTARWTADHERAIDPKKVPRPAGLHDRNVDNWKPLLAIATEIGGRWPVLAIKAAMSLCSAEFDEVAAASVLLDDLREIFAADEALFTRTILKKLHAREDRPWPEWKNDKPITGRQLGILLADFGIKPAMIKVEGKSARGYRREWFTDAWARYPRSEGGRVEGSSGAAGIVESGLSSIPESPPTGSRPADPQPFAPQAGLRGNQPVTSDSGGYGSEGSDSAPQAGSYGSAGRIPPNGDSDVSQRVDEPDYDAEAERVRRKFGEGI